MSREQLLEGLANDHANCSTYEQIIYDGKTDSLGTQEMRDFIQEANQIHACGTNPQAHAHPELIRARSVFG